MGGIEERGASRGRGGVYGDGSVAITMGFCPWLVAITTDVVG